MPSHPRPRNPHFGTGRLPIARVDEANVVDVQVDTLRQAEAKSAALLDDHGAAADPHAVYQKVAERGEAGGYAQLGATSLVLPEQLGSGTANATKVLQGDSSWGASTGTGSVVRQSYVDALAAALGALAYLNTLAGSLITDDSIPFSKLLKTGASKGEIAWFDGSNWVRFPSAAGVLTNDGSGNLSWQGG